MVSVAQVLVRATQALLNQLGRMVWCNSTSFSVSVKFNKLSGYLYLPKVAYSIFGPNHRTYQLCSMICVITQWQRFTCSFYNHSAMLHNCPDGLCVIW